MRARLLAVSIPVLSFAVLGPVAHADLLVTDRFGDRVMRFSSVDGSVIDLNFIPDDNTLNSPMEAIAVGSEIWVADQNLDAVVRYPLTGGAPLGNAIDATNNIDNIRGFEVVGNRMYVTNFGTGNGAPGPGVRIFDITNPAAPLDLGTATAPGNRSPWDVQLLGSDLIVTDDTAISANPVLNTGAIYRFDTSGNFTSLFAAGSQAGNGLSFPKGAAATPDGTLLVGNNGTPNAVWEFDADGNVLNVWSTQRDPDDFNDDLRVNGVWQLDNGLIFFAAEGTGVVGTNGLYTLNPLDGQITPIITGATRPEGDVGFIPHFISFAVIPEPGSLSLLGLAAAAVRRRRR